MDQHLRFSLSKKAMTHLSNSAFVHGQVAILPPYLVAQMHIFLDQKSKVWMVLLYVLAQFTSLVG